MIISLERAKEVVGQFSRQRILVVGDLMLDRYIRGTVERISPEAPVPVVRVDQEKNMPGGAANVAMNIQSLGGHALLGGVVGRDDSAKHLMGVLADGKIGTQGVMAMKGIRTAVKTRIVAEQQQVVRVDWEDPIHVGAAMSRFCSKLAALTAGVTGVIIEDYGKGTIRQEVVNAVLRVARQKKIPVGFDPNINNAVRIPGATIATPNCREAHHAAGVKERSMVHDPAHDRVLRKVGRLLLAKWKLKQLIVTLGSQGMYLVSRDKPPRVIPTRAREVFDVSGAGDTVIAACLLAIASGATYDEAAVIGNYAAGVVVGKLGTATCSREELLACISEDERLNA